MASRGSTVVMALLFLGACGPRRPEEPVAPASIPVSAPVPVPEKSSGPLTLERAIATAFERNPGLRAAAERIAIAEARVIEAGAAFYPEFGARVSYVKTDNPAQAFGMIVSQRRFSPAFDVNDPGSVANWRPELVGSFAVFRGGADAHAFEAARDGREAADHERSAVRNALAEAVTATWYALLGAREQVAVARASVEAVEGGLAEARKRFDAGALLKSDVLSLEVRRAAAREGGIRAGNAVEQARAGLKALLGSDPGEIDPGAPAAEPLRERTFAEALARASADRPELRASARLIELRRHEVEAEKGAFLPRVDLFGSYGFDDGNLEFSRRQDNWTFGIAVDLNLFSGFRSAARTAAAERRLAEAAALLEQVRLEVEQEVRGATLALGEAEERVKVGESAVAAGEEALRLVRGQFDGGTVTVTRYLEAEAALADARSRAIAARYDVRRAEARVRKSVGAWK